MKRRLHLFAVAVWLAVLANGSAVERFVPEGGALNYPTIQAAVTASVAGDIVRVQPGTYQESITFRSVDITLTSMNPGDSNVVQTTIIQGDGTNSVVSFASGQTTNTVFTGFTVRGGGGTVYSTDLLLGGGIYCYQSSPSIVGNIIEENHLTLDSTNLYSYGGAISCWDASPRIVRNIIRNNSANGGGAILSVSGGPVIQDNWIYNNTASFAGAAYLSDQGWFLNNTLFENTPDNLYVDATGLMANNIIANLAPATGVIANGSLSWFQYNDVWEPAGTEILQVIQTETNWITVPTSLAGTNGNLAVDPLFVSAANYDLNLSAASPCINAGDPSGLRSSNELDIAGGSRVFALRVNMGASEFRGDRNFPPIANAGPDQTITGWTLGSAVVLDGSASIDPDGDPLAFTWLQTAGPAVALLVTNAQASFTPAGLGEYRFELVVSDGVYDSTPDAVRVVITNLPPVASAGLGQSLPVVPEVLVLDGSHSLDPEGQPLSYHWRQTAGPFVPLITPKSPRPVIRPPAPGMYEFELIVSDEFSPSPPDSVKFYLGQCPPVANAGPTRYAGRPAIKLDGSGSFAPNSSAPLQYAWRQVSGPLLILWPTNVVNPGVSGFAQAATNQEAVFELVVSASGLASAPSTVKVVIVPAWNNSTISQVNPPFNTNRPTVFGFAGGNCNTGGAMSFPASWYQVANLFTISYTRDATSSTSDPRYFGYGDQLIVLLSSLAPAYDQLIQTMGHSTGCMPACDIAERFNITYKDSRYLVNRIALLDSGCGRDYNANIRNLASNRMPGKMFWVDNYYASAGRFRPGILNVEFPVPPADHSTPNTWYFPSWTLGAPYRATNFNNGVFAGAFFSPVGPGKNYQLETDRSEYYFGWTPPPTATFPLNKLVQMSPALYPARLPGVVELNGPTNGIVAAEHSVVFSCQPVLNAVKYQILVGPDAHRVNQLAWEGLTPPNQSLPKLPFARTWWKIRAADAYGTTSWSDPRCVLRDSDADGLSDEAEVLTSHTDPDNPDSDGDGVSDGNEVNVYFTNPLMPDPVVLSSPAVLPNSDFSLTLTNAFGRDVVVQASTDLENWVAITNFLALQQTIQIIDTTTPKPPARFYRAVLGHFLSLGESMTFTDAGFSFRIENLSGRGLALLVSTNLQDWETLTNFGAEQTRFQYLDPESVQQPARFYRAQLQ